MHGVEKALCRKEDEKLQKEQERGRGSRKPDIFSDSVLAIDFDSFEVLMPCT